VDGNCYAVKFSVAFEAEQSQRTIYTVLVNIGLIAFFCCLKS